MISKSLSLPSSKPDSARISKTLDFAHYYKAAADSNTTLKKDTKVNSNDLNETSRRQSHNKISKRNSNGPAVTMAKIGMDGQNLVPNLRQTSPTSVKITSTPNKTKKKLNIKSIMKDSPASEKSLDLSNVPKLNRKKRNKSVSFMLEDNDEVVIKKTKSDESLVQKTEEKKPKMKNKRFKKIQKEDKENVSNPSKNDIQKDSNNEIIKKKTLMKKNKNINTDNYINNNHDNVIGTSITSKTENNSTVSNCNITAIDIPIDERQDVKKKRRKFVKASKSVEKANTTDIDGNKCLKENVGVNVKKSKRLRKNKHPAEASEIGEPEKKTLKKSKPDNIAEGIENLNIGDNAHTLTNMLDEMTVTKAKKKNIKTAKREISNSDKKSEGKPKNNRNSRKRRNRKMHAGIIVQNLPFRILLSYKQKLRDFFSKYGTVQSIGVADLKCGQNEAQPIFTTRVFFKTEEEATAALDGDNELYEGNIIRVKKLSAQVTRIFKPSKKNGIEIDEAKGDKIKKDIMDNDSN